MPLRASRGCQAHIGVTTTTRRIGTRPLRRRCYPSKLATRTGRARVHKSCERDQRGICTASGFRCCRRGIVNIEITATRRVRARATTVGVVDEGYGAKSAPRAYARVERAPAGPDAVGRVIEDARRFGTEWSENSRARLGTLPIRIVVQTRTFSVVVIMLRMTFHEPMLTLERRLRGLARGTVVTRDPRPPRTFETTHGARPTAASTPPLADTGAGHRGTLPDHWPRGACAREQGSDPAASDTT